MEFEAHDVDKNKKLDYREFSCLVREREVGVFSELVLAYRFQELDPQGTGYVTFAQYLLASLKDALARSSSLIIDLFSTWDEDGDGEISREEFRKVIRALGFNASNAELDAVFDELDFVDHSGTLSYVELNRALRLQAPLPEDNDQKGVASSARHVHQLRRGTPLADKLVMASEDLDIAESAEEIASQLRDILERNLQRVIDIFRAWDEDYSGTIDKKEFRAALRSLGLRAPKEVIDSLFDEFDDDGNGDVDYNELNQRLRRRVEIDEKLRAGAAGKIETKAKNKFGLDRSKSTGDIRRSRVLNKTVLNAHMSITEQLAVALNESRVKVMNLFNEWDTDGDGRIDKGELFAALQSLGITDTEQAKQSSRELFRLVDRDRSGTIDYRELVAALRAKAIAAEQAAASEEAALAAIGKPPLPQNGGGWCPTQKMLLPPRAHVHAVWDPSKAEFVMPDGGSPSNLPKGFLTVMDTTMRVKSCDARFLGRLHAMASAKSVLRDPQDLVPAAPLAASVGVGAAPTESSAGSIRPRKPSVVYKPMHQRQPVLPKAELRQSQSLPALPPRELPQRQQTSRVLSGFVIDVGSGMTMLEQLAVAIHESRARVLHLFQEWDTSGDGLISVDELQKGLQQLGLATDGKSRMAAEDLFQSIDTDASGTVELMELFRSVRRKADMLSQARQKAEQQQKKHGPHDMPLSDALNEEHAGDAPPGKLTTAPSVPLMPTRVHPPLATPLPPPKAPVPLPSSASTGSPWYEDVKPFQIHRYKLRPPPMRLGMQPSILSQSRSLASLHAEATSDDSWFRSAKLARILPAPLPMPSDIPSPSVPVSRALSKAAAELGKSLAGSLKKLGDLFKRFDRDGSGSIDRLEFRLVVKELDLSASEQVCDLVFSEFDADGSGKVDYREYMVKLLRDKLASERARVMDLFRKWDIDDSGSISKSEFRRGVKAIGFEAPAAQLNALFDAMDVDRSGQLSFKELNARLRQVSYL